VPKAEHEYDGDCDAFCKNCFEERETTVEHTYDNACDAVCNVCGAERETEHAPGHAYESVVTPPTATEDGYTTYTCSVCGDTYTEAIIPVAFTVTADNREQVGYTEESNGNLIIPAIFRAEDGTWYRTTAIGEGAFRGCLDLISVEIPQTVTSIGAYAFSGCTALEWIRYTGNKEQWDALAKGSSWDDNTGDYTFKCAPTVIETLPFTYVVSAATGLDLTGVFFNFTATEAVTLLITIPAGTSLSTEASNSYDFDGNGNILLPVNAGETVTLNFWSGTTIYTGVFTVAVAEPEAPDDCIDGHSYDASVTPPTATEDGYTTYTCSECGNTYTEAIIPVAFTVTANNREQIGYTGENGENLVIPETFQGDDGTWYRVTEIDFQAFKSCTNLVTVTIPAGVKMIDTYAFSGCSNLTSVSLSEGVASIALEAFSNCTSLTSITIPDSVIFMEQHVFASCTSLSSVTFGNGLTKIENGTFALCTSLTSITIPDHVTEIGESAFDGSGLTSIIIPDSVTTIGQSAFTYCTALTSVTISDSVTTIGQSAFNYCPALTSITFEGTVVQWNAITKGNNWNFNVPATEIICSDGVISLG
jgi:hypothetical protein